MGFLQRNYATIWAGVVSGIGAAFFLTGFKAIAAFILTICLIGLGERYDAMLAERNRNDAQD